MIQQGTNLRVADNTGAKLVRVIRVLGGSARRYGRIGDIVVAAVKVAEPRKAVQKKAVVRGVIVRQRQPFRRKDGSYLRFDENEVVILEGLEPKGGRVFGPLPREIKERGFEKLASLAEEIV